MRKALLLLVLALSITVAAPFATGKYNEGDSTSPLSPPVTLSPEVVNIYRPPVESETKGIKKDREPQIPSAPPKDLAVKGVTASLEQLLEAADKKEEEDPGYAAVPLSEDSGNKVKDKELDVSMPISLPEALPKEAPKKLPPKGNIVLVTYHALYNEAPSKDKWQFFRTASDFEKDLALFRESGIPIKSYGEVLTALKNGDPSVHEPALIIQFDDGLMSDHRLAFPLLKKYGIKSTHFISSVRAETRQAGFMTFDEIRDMQRYRSERGDPLIELGAHGGNHVAVSREKDETEEDFLLKLHTELELSKGVMERELGKACDLLALPFGSGFKEEAVEDYGKALGYTLMRGWRKDLGHFTGFSPQNMKFFAVYNNSDLKDALKLARGE